MIISNAFEFLWVLIHCNRTFIFVHNLCLVFAFAFWPVPCSFDLANKLDIISILGRVSVLWLLCVRLEESLKRSTWMCSGLWKYQLSNLPVAEKKYDIQPRSRLHLCLSLRWYFAFNWLQLELGETWTGDTQSALCSDSVSPQPPIILYYKLDLQANDENAKAYDKLTAPKGQARLHLLLHALLC